MTMDNEDGTGQIKLKWTISEVNGQCGQKWTMQTEMDSADENGQFRRKWTIQN